METHVKDPPFLQAILCRKCGHPRHPDRRCNHIIERSFVEEYLCQCGDERINQVKKRFTAASKKAKRVTRGNV